MKNSSDENEPKEMDKMNPSTNGAGDVHNAQTAFPTKKTPRDILRERLQNARTVIEKRYNLIILLLALLSFLLLLIVIILAVQLAGHGNETNDLCGQSECLAAASTVMASLNSTFDPCEDFWSYTCDRWIQEHPLPKNTNKGSLSVRDEMKTDVYLDIRHQIDLIPKKKYDRSPEFKVKKFYESCMNVEGDDHEAPTWIKRQISELSGWSLTKNFVPSDFKRLKVLQNLHVKYGVMPFFKISVVDDDFHPSAPIIKVILSYVCYINVSIELFGIFCF